MRYKNIFFIIIAVLISMALKLYYAYICSSYIYCDTAIMGLIAKQILRGEFPLFFYGGFYTWVVESWFIALFFFLFGVSNYTIHLGPISVSILFLISVYLLGKEIKNKKVGFLALIYTAIPPFYFFKYSVIPVGYLAELPLFGNIVLILTLMITRKRGVFYFCLLGLAGAICFWLHPIALYYLVSAALFLFIYMIATRRFRYYFFGGLCGLLLFFIGGLPCWIFNLRHDFISFKFSTTEATFNILHGLNRFITYQVPGILGNDLFTIVIFTAGLLLIIWNRKWLFLLFFISTAVLFSQGGAFVRGLDYRYIIPIFSLVPIAIAYLLERLKHLGAGILVILVSLNVYNINKGISHDRKEFRDEGRGYNELVSYLTGHKIGGVYGALRDVSTINFIGRDKVYAAEVLYSANPVDEKVIGTKRIGYINWDNYRNVFDMLCKSYRFDHVNRYSIIYDFKPWGYYGEEILPEGWKARSNCNPDWAGFAFDRNLDRYWSSIQPKQTGIYYEIEFPQTYKIYKFQVFNMPADYRNLTERYRFFVSTDGREWRLIKEGSGFGMFWSGPHVIWRKKDTLWEVIFHPVEARFVRIENIDESKYDSPLEINEIIFYRYLGERENRYKDFLYNAKKAYEFLLEKGIRFAYADYWLSEKIRTWSGGAIKTLRIYNRSWPDRPNTTRLMEMDKGTAIVVNNENELAVEDVLTELGLKFQKEKIGDYTCFYDLEKFSYLYWIGAGVSKVNIRGLGEFLIEKSPDAIRYYSGNTGIYLRLLNLYRQSGIKKIIKHKFIPRFSYEVSFSNGVEFLGWSISKKEIARGDTFKADYFWSVKRELKEIGHLFVFVHFIKDGQIIFQNDHRLLENYLRPHVSLAGGVWKERHTVKIPMSVPSGEYIVRLGLWLPEKGGKRIKILGSRSTSVEIGKVDIGQDELFEGLKGRIVFQSDAAGNKEIYVMDADGSNVKRLTSTTADSSYPNWSPDGKSIVFVSNRDGNNEIYIMDRNGDNERRLTDNPGDDVSPSWHPDGKRIIFVSDMDGAMDFYLMDKDGGGLTRITDFKEGVHDLPRISPDGREIIFTSNMSLGWQLFKIDIDGSNLKKMTGLPLGHCEGVWSRDGEKILFISRLGSGNSDIYIMDRDGSNEQRLTTDSALNYNPGFSPDDKKIIFSTERDGNWEIYVINRDGSNPVRITYTDAREEWSDWYTTD